MIQVYSPENTDYERNGNIVLYPEECKATSELGGVWFLEIIHPIDDEGRWKNIEREAVLSVPTFMGKKQLYRIFKITDKTDTEISAKAYPIFFDSADEIFLMDKRPTEKNGQEALDDLMSGTKYNGESNIAKRETAYFIRRNLMDCISGDDSPSFVKKWGGEPLYDNHKIILNERAGGVYGAEIRYGKNMNGISYREDMSSVVTRIIPVAFNGRTLSADYIDSPLINKYAKIYAKEIKFENIKLEEDLMEGEDTNGLIVCATQEELDAALTEKCNEQFAAGIDLYSVTVDVDVVSLEKTEEYKDFESLVKIGLGDTVNCYNNRIGVGVQARAIKIIWDCITDTVSNVVLGDYEKDILSNWNATVSKIENSWKSTTSKIENAIMPDGSVNAALVTGILDGIKTQLKVQTTTAQKQDVRAILFEDLNEESELYGALAIGTQGIQISRERTIDGRDWNWTTAITAKGMIADALITGLIVDKDGKNFWNLDTGEIQIKNGVINVSGQKVFGAENYSEEDLNICQEINVGTREITPELLEKYDFDGKGYTNAQDLIKIRKLLNGDAEQYTLDISVEINGLEKNSIIKTEGVYIGKKGAMLQNATIIDLYAKKIRTIDSDGVSRQGVSGVFAVGDKNICVCNGVIYDIR